MFLVKLLLGYTLLPAQESLPCGAEAAEMPSHLLGSWLSCQYSRLSSSTPAPRAASCRVDGCLKPGGAAACQMSPEDETCCHRRGSASGRSLRSRPEKNPCGNQSGITSSSTSGWLARTESSKITPGIIWLPHVCCWFVQRLNPGSAGGAESPSLGSGSPVTWPTAWLCGWAEGGLARLSGNQQRQPPFITATGLRCSIPPEQPAAGSC